MRGARGPVRTGARSHLQQAIQGPRVASASASAKDSLIHHTRPHDVDGVGGQRPRQAAGEAGAVKETPLARGQLTAAPRGRETASSRPAHATRDEGTRGAEAHTPAHTRTAAPTAHAAARSQRLINSSLGGDHL